MDNGRELRIRNFPAELKRELNWEADEDPRTTPRSLVIEAVRREIARRRKARADREAGGR